MIAVELHPAGFWICEECGRHNYLRLLPDPHDYHRVLIPWKVTCEFCRQVFACDDNWFQTGDD